MSPVLLNPSRFGTTPPASLSSLILADSPLWFIKSDETSGTTMVDSSGNARDGTYTGTPTLSATGLVSDGGSAVTYNGSTQYGTVSFASWMNGLTELTMVGVVKSSATSGSVVSRSGTSTSTAYRIGYTGGKAFVAVGTGTETLCSGAVSVNDNARHLIAGVWTGTQLRLLVDGVLDNTALKNGTLTALGSVGLHVAQRNSDSFWAGTLDYAAIIPTALSDARIAAYNAAL